MMGIGEKKKKTHQQIQKQNRGKNKDSRDKNKFR